MREYPVITIQKTATETETETRTATRTATETVKIELKPSRAKKIAETKENTTTPDIVVVFYRRG